MKPRRSWLKNMRVFERVFNLYEGRGLDSRKRVTNNYSKTRHSAENGLPAGHGWRGDCAVVVTTLDYETLQVVVQRYAKIH